jgi:AcrR family transcriptional regulator
MRPFAPGSDLASGDGLCEGAPMSAAELSTASSRRIRQKRSQKTYDALIATAFKLLEQREFDEISIADLAQRAGYSVGAFYARFKSKDELFDAMLEQHINDRRRTRARQFATASDSDLIRDLFADTVEYYWARRRFWRAALFRSIRDEDFWVPIRRLSYELGDALVARISARAQRPLSEEEDTNVRFAVQVALGTVNNAIINRPGPIFIGQQAFVDNVIRAFRLVSGYDELIASGAKSKRARSQKGR